MPEAVVEATESVPPSHCRSVCVEEMTYHRVLLQRFRYWGWKNVEFDVLFVERPMVECLHISHKTVSPTRLFFRPV